MASMPLTLDSSFLVSSTAGVGLVAVHASSLLWQLPWLVVTKLLISVTCAGRVASTLTVKDTTVVLGPPALAAGSATFLVQLFGGAVGVEPASHPVQSPSGPA